MLNPFIWILEKILGPRMTREERIAHIKRLQEGPDETSAAPVTDAQIETLVRKIDSMRAPLMACRPQAGPPSTRADESRLGGWPGWPEGEALPEDTSGRPMLFLCQINFAEMPPLEPFPADGLMQVFVASDDLYGCAFPSLDRQGFTVLYRPDPAGLTTIDPYAGGEPELTVLQGDLHRQGRPIAFERQEMVPPPAHYLIAAQIDAMWRQDKSADYDRIDEYCDGHKGPEMYLGGYPRFVQSDIRTPDHLADYDQVVMQFGAPDGMMWGDVGEACFLMRRQDLKNRAFETAIYNWDCS